MTRKQIDQSREARLWITQVVVPAAVITVGVMKNDRARAWVKAKFENLKKSIKKLFKKK